MKGVLRVAGYLVVLQATTISSAPCETAVASRQSWMGGLKIGLVLPRNWGVTKRDDSETWPDKAYSIQIKRDRAGNHGAGPVSAEVVFTKSYEARLWREGAIPGRKPDRDMAKEGFRYIRNFRISSGQRGVVSIWDGGKDQSGKRQACEWSFVMNIPGKYESKLVVSIDIDEPYSADLNRKFIEVLRSLELRSSLSNWVAAQRSKHRKIVFVP